MHQFHRWFYLLVIPVLWGLVSLLHFQSPGDEYGLWVISAIAGTWIHIVAPSVGDIHQLWIRYGAAGTGILVMFGIGWLLVWLKVRVRIWLALWFVGTGVLFYLLLRQFPSIERAVAKNGSLDAYFLSAMLLAMYVATLLGIAGGIIKLGYRKLRKNAAQISTTKSVGAREDGRTKRLALLGESLDKILPSNARRSNSQA